MIFNYDVSDLLNRLAALQEAIGEDISDVEGDIGKAKSSVAVVEDGDTATHEIATGTYVIWKGDMYKASSDIDVGDTLSASNLTAVTGGGLNELAALLATEISDRIAAFNGFSIDLSAGKNTIADVVSAASQTSNGDLVVIWLSTTLANTFLGIVSDLPAVAFVFKASVNNAYFFVFNRDGASSGNLSLVNSTITALHTFVPTEDVASMFVNERSMSVDNVSISPSSMVTIDTVTSTYSSYKPSKAGYTPIAISGFTVANAGTGGSNYDKCSVNTMLLYSGGNVYARVRNHSSTDTAKVKISANILWVKNS